MTPIDSLFDGNSMLSFLWHINTDIRLDNKAIPQPIINPYHLCDDNQG